MNIFIVKYVNNQIYEATFCIGNNIFIEENTNNIVCKFQLKLRENKKNMHGEST